MHTVKIGDIRTKNTHILTISHPRLINMVPTYPWTQQFNLVVRYANYLISIFMNINENLRNDR